MEFEFSVMRLTHLLSNTIDLCTDTRFHLCVLIIVSFFPILTQLFDNTG